MIRNQTQVNALQSNFSTHNKKKATRKRFQPCFERAKDTQTGAHQQIQKICANEKIKAERKMQSFAKKQSFTKPHGRKKKSLTQQKKVEHVAWKKNVPGSGKRKAETGTRH